MDICYATSKKVLMVPIDESQAFDIYYRYKMPQLLLKYITNFTIIENLDDVCNSLKCDPLLFCKFLKKSLHTNVTRKKQCKIQGEYTCQQLSDCVVNFIGKYILCKNCGLPELNQNSCQACGKKI